MLKYIWILFVPMMGLSQSNLDSKGISFIQLDSWQEVLVKAKTEGKFIFIDCYTTWCGPCKRMDKEIFALPSVGSVYNKNFISVKVQMDRTLRDKNEVKKWYDDADSIKAWYKVESYPTYLFFSPDGKPVHKALGALNAEQFQSLALDALDPQKQSYMVEAKFANENKFDVKSMSDAELKQMAISYKYTFPEVSGNMALEFTRRLNGKTDFKNNYDFISQFNKNLEIRKLAANHVKTLNNEEMLQLYSRENFHFFTQFMNSSIDRLFTFLLQNTVVIDSIMNKNYEYQLQYSYMWLNSIITKEEVMPFLEKSGTIPDWKNLHKLVKGKYGEPYATMNVHIGKMEWLMSKRDWKNYTKEIVLYMDNFGATLQRSWYLNNYAWEIFLYSDDQDELAKALSWSGRAILYDPTANWMDTYGNILYKLGKRNMAIHWQEIAIKLDSGNKNIQANLEKMNKGEPTWENY